MENYEGFEKVVVKKFAEVAAENDQLFRTDADARYDLFGLYLSNLPAENRQHYNCNACRHFIQRYGGLVTIDTNGHASSALWEVSSDLPVFFRNAVRELQNAVEKSTVTGIFRSENKVLGTPVTGNWTHLHVELPRNRIFSSIAMLPSQYEAAKFEEFKMLQTAHSQYSKEVVDKAVALINSNTMYRGDQVKGVAEWFQALVHKTNISANLLWRAVAAAPAGFCHIRSSMIGTLLDDIASGMDMTQVASRFAEKMDPGNYQRAQVAPTMGNIQQAEQIVKKLGLENSLRRRYARLDEIPNFLWKDRHIPNKAFTGVFGNITPKAVVKNDATVLPSSTMTWDKFQRTVLPEASGLSVYIDNPSAFMAMVTAADAEAPNMLQWSNPFSWYYAGGSDAEMKRRVEAAGGKFEDNLIRATLMWDSYTDLDVHCEGPDGHICWRHKHGSYGYLDVDANGIDGKTITPVENIRWATVAPSGLYEIYVHTYNTYRSENETPFKIELQIGNQIYRYAGVAGYTGWKKTIFRFHYHLGNIGSMDMLGTQGIYAQDSDWSLPSGLWADVTGVVSSPNYWDKVGHGQEHVFFLLDGLKDQKEGRGRGLFTEMLKPELREIRKTLDAYMAATPIEGAEDASACGVGYSRDRAWNLTVKVTGGGTSRIIKIDRWD